MESYGHYIDAGVVMGVGTDTISHNFIKDIRSAAILGRVAEHDGNTASTGDVFHAGTAGSAKALMRDDIGRLVVGAKEDVLVVDCIHPIMLPSRDPVRCLLDNAADRAIRDVYIDGQKTMRNDEILTLPARRRRANRRPLCPHEGCCSGNGLPRPSKPENCVFILLCDGF